MEGLIIPQRLKEIAEDLGLNTINFVKTDKKLGNIFSLCLTDDTGEYLPIGLPILYSVKGSSIIELPDFVADEILSNIKE